MNAISDAAGGIRLASNRPPEIIAVIGVTTSRIYFLGFQPGTARRGRAGVHEMVSHFDLLAPLYEWFGPSPDPEPLVEQLALPTEGILLDAGGGTGRVSSVLRPYVSGVVVSDLSLPMLERARTKEGLWPAQSDVLALPFPDNSFSRVLVVDALHHFGNQHRALGELLRVLHPGGRLVIQEPVIDHPAVKLVGLVERIMLMESRFLSPADMAQMASDYGTTVSIVPNGRFSVWVIVEKAALAL